MRLRGFASVADEPEGARAGREGEFRVAVWQGYGAWVSVGDLKRDVVEPAYAEADAGVGKANRKRWL